MNSRALIGSPGALWICASRLPSRGRRAPPGSSRRRRPRAGGSGRVGASPGPPLGTARPAPRSRRAVLTCQPRALRSRPAGHAARSGSRIPETPPAARAPTPGQRGPRGKAGPSRAPASPFSPDSFDPRALRRTSAPGLPGSARGGPGNCPQLISFHQAALGALKPRSQ